MAIIFGKTKHYQNTKIKEINKFLFLWELAFCKHTQVKQNKTVTELVLYRNNKCLTQFGDSTLVDKIEFLPWTYCYCWLGVGGILAGCLH